MHLTFSDTSALPRQLQIESQVRGTQKLAYLPTTGPSLDFYYLNYRPTYIAGQSTIDFWMISPKGTREPKTASLELFDEFGKVRLATLVKEGTEIPQAVASMGKPFLWKSWVVPKELKSDFDFSEKFRVVLRTSDTASAPSTPAASTTAAAGDGKTKAIGKKVVKNDKRTVSSSLLNKIFKRAPAPAKESAASTPTTVKATGFVVVQDRQFRIKGLQATPGGKPNPAKLNVNSVSQPPTTNTNANIKDSTTAGAATNSNKNTDTTSAAQVVSQAEGIDGTRKKTSTGTSSLSSINLSVSMVIITLTVALFSLLGLFL
ncbi:hypothetical protein BGX29_011101 [Mortierella sp. GBA35]|nr:hypothetical protein BGX29_011101 [Mortierella sp. GBA35]